MKKLILIAVAVFAVLFPGMLIAQQDFEAATVKPNNSGQRGSSLPPPIGGRFTATNVSLKQLILYAYHIQDFQLSGGPAWTSSETYDVVAKADGNATEDQVRIMLQRLLTERFKLKVRRESRTAPIYALVVAKNGLKMPRSAGDCTFPGTVAMPCGGFRVYKRSSITGQNVPLTELLDTLSILTGRLVVDKTGLTGRFDITLKWSPDATLALPAESGDADGGADGTLFTALQEQLGLKLDSQKAPIPFFIVDAAQRPNANLR